MRPAVILTPYFSGSRMPFALKQTQSGFLIGIAAYPWSSFILMTLVIWSMGAGLIWIAIKSRDREMIIGMSIPCALAGIGAPLGHIWEYLWHKTRGPVLSYNSSEKSFYLPRQGLTVPASEIESFAVVTARQQGRENAISQFQMYVRGGKTHHLITCRKPSELQAFIRAIQKQTDAQVTWQTNAVDDDELEAA